MPGPAHNVSGPCRDPISPASAGAAAAAFQVQLRIKSLENLFYQPNPASNSQEQVSVRKADPGWPSSQPTNSQKQVRKKKHSVTTFGQNRSQPSLPAHQRKKNKFKRETLSKFSVKTFRSKLSAKTFLTPKPLTISINPNP